MCINIPVYISLDTKSILCINTTSKQLREIRLINERACICCAYCKNQVNYIACIFSEQIIENNFIIHAGNSIISKTLRTGRLSFFIRQ